MGGAPPEPQLKLCAEQGERYSDNNRDLDPTKFTILDFIF